jgi:uncharacterized membrane protein
MNSHDLSAVFASGAASLVEFIEALTVVLAAAAARGGRSAIAGALAAVVLLATLVAVFGPTLMHLPLAPAQLILGTLLVLFGTRWLRKATLRAAGIIPLRDEMSAFRRHSDRIGNIDMPVARWDIPGFAASFQATAIEGFEVVFIVVAIGTGGPGLLLPAIYGAVLALVLVSVAGLLLHRPITRIPENTLKRIVGAMLSGLGTFWIGEAAGLGWPGGDLSVPALGVAYLIVSVATATRLRHVGSVAAS